MLLGDTWRLLSIDQCCHRVTSGGTPSRRKSEFYVGGTVPWIKTGELRDRFIDPAKIEERITEEALTRSSAKLLPSGTVLMAMYGDGQTIGSLGLVRSSIACNQACCAMIPNTEVCDPLFLFYAIRLYRNDWIKIAHGGAQRNLSGTIIKARQIRVPDLHRQRRIAATLSIYDDLIENNTRRIASLEEMARRLYEEWFVHFRFPGHEDAKFVTAEEGRHPADWELGSLPNFVELKYGKALKAEDRANGTVPVYGSSGVVGWHNESLVDGPGLIVGRKGNVGSVFWSQQSFYPIDTVYYVQTSLPLEYVYFNLKLQNFLNNDAAVPGLSRQQAYSLPFLCPSHRVLRPFIEACQPLLSSARLLGRKNANLCAQRDMLLPKLISGEIDLSGAEELLEAAE